MSSGKRETFEPEMSVEAETQDTKIKWGSETYLLQVNDRRILNILLPDNTKLKVRDWGRSNPFSPIGLMESDWADDEPYIQARVSE